MNDSCNKVMGVQKVDTVDVAETCGKWLSQATSSQRQSGPLSSPWLWIFGFGKWLSENGT